MTKTLSELFKRSYDAQNASNLCGVVQSFAKDMIELMEHCKSTQERNEHLLVSMWINKLMQLNRYSEKKVDDAYLKHFDLERLEKIEEDQDQDAAWDIHSERERSYHA